MRNYLLPLLLLLLFFVRTSAQSDGFAPQGLPAEINTAYDESYPLISVDGKSLLFTRKGHPRNIGLEDREDVWISHLQNEGLWSPAINIGSPANNASPNRAIGINASNNQLFLFYREQGQIFRAEKEGRLWSQLYPIALEAVPHIPQSSHLHVGPSNILLLSLQQEHNGQGDLFVIKSITSPYPADTLRLPAAINSIYDERDAFLAADEKTLYFSSNRPEGVGGYDLYYSRRLDETWENWSAPEALDGNINSSSDELSPSVPASGNPLYFIRKVPMGHSDIFKAEIPKHQQPIPVVLLTAQFIDAQSKAPVSASLELKSQNGQEVSPLQYLPASGSHILILPNQEKIALSADIPGYFPVTKTLSNNLLDPQEELDYDPLQVMASTEYRSQAGLQEMEAMRFQLQQLDEELLALNEMREQKKAEALKRRTEWVLALDLSDPKLDALRHKYQQYLYDIQEDTIPVIPDDVVSTYDELGDMSTRFQRFYDYQKKLQEQKDEQAKEEDFLWEEDVQLRAPSDEPNWTEKLLSEVAHGLQDSLYENARQELGHQLSGAEKELLENQAEQFKQDLGLSFLSQTTEHNWTSKGTTPSDNGQEAAWETALRNDLRSAIDTDNESWEALQEEVKSALKADMLHWLKKEQRKNLQESWETRLQTLYIAQVADSVAALIPVAKSPEQYREIEHDIALYPLAKGQLIPLEDIVFEANKSALKATSYQVLENLFRFLKSNPFVVAELRVHAGGQLENNHATQLTNIRAEVLADYLIGHGIPEERIRFKGMGNSAPVADPKSAEGQRLNQRVELWIVEM